MVQITNGSVTFARSIKPADYETKRAEYTLNFVLDEGEGVDDALSVAGHFAQQHTLKLLAKEERIVAAVEQRASAPVKPADEIIQGMENAVKAEKARRAVQPVVEEFDPLDGSATSTPAASSPTPSASADYDPLIDGKAEPAAREISDAELTQAVNKARERIDPARIKTLRDEITGVVGKTMALMSQAERGKFVAALAAAK